MYITFSDAAGLDGHVCQLCESCGGEPDPIGQAGSVLWMRCRVCSVEWPEPANSAPEIVAGGGL